MATAGGGNAHGKKVNLEGENRNGQTFKCNKCNKAIRKNAVNKEFCAGCVDKTDNNEETQDHENSTEETADKKEREGKTMAELVTSLTGKVINLYEELMKAREQLAEKSCIIKFLEKELSKRGNTVADHVVQEQQEEKIAEILTPETSYAHAVKKAEKKRCENESGQQTLIIQAKNEEKVANNLKEKIKINELSASVTSMKETKKGTVVITVSDKKSSDEIRDKVKQTMGESCSVKTPNVKHRVKIYVQKGTDVPKENADILQALIKKNDIDTSIDNFEMKIVFVSQPNEFRQSVCIVMEVDEVTRDHLLTYRQGKIALGWSLHNIVQDFNLKICKKCNGYGHLAKFCTATHSICRFCAEKHESKECTNKDLKKCCNCVFRNNKFELKLDVNHCAGDSNACESHKRIVEIQIAKFA